MAARKKSKKEDPQQPLTAIEMKLLQFALDKGAYQGEADNAAVMLIRKLRERNVKAEDLFGYNQAQTTTAVSKCGNEKMTFGKYRNVMIKNVSADYLLWAIYNCANMDVKLRLAIHKFLMAE